MAAAAYRSGHRLYDNMQGKWLGRRDDPDHTVEHETVIAPDGAPDWCCDRQQLWNMVERREVNLTDGKLKEKAQLYREIELTLPRELSKAERAALVETYVREQFVSEGMVADVAIHNRTASDGQPQPHAHIMLTMRQLEDRPDKLEKGILFGNKVREWNDSDQQIAAMAEAKRKRGQLQNDVRRYGPTETLATALEGASDHLRELKAAPPAPGEHARKQQQAALRRMNKKVVGLQSDASRFGGDARLDVALSAAEIEVSERQKEMRLYRWRAAWSEATNKALEMAGSDERIDHRTLAAQRQEALANGDFLRAEKLDRAPQKPVGIAGRIHDAYTHLKDNVHTWAAVEVRGKMERAFAHLGTRDPVRLSQAMLRIQDWTEEVVERFNREPGPDDMIPEVRRGPRP
ncbi:MobA/MobL family protein (plasmid) [Acuticoccus sp. MNP-M23]|uniref:MobA/MobL family protein n=1 Tax=Acuticoccus sp. MNP-M23 TaxID=3072793 RepID=UPI002815DF54|nr:MobA/MobL family protein [Acuticoccus sp. MNP-M23]WMS45346.1 MobA/MobL family protein [Acuticoccus sp. MNP-M23]